MSRAAEPISDEALAEQVWRLWELAEEAMRTADELVALLQKRRAASGRESVEPSAEPPGPPA